MTAPKQRPKYYDLNLLHLPAPGIVSIFHRISGVLLFLVAVPAVLATLGATLESESVWSAWRSALANPLAKLALIGAIWLYVHHFIAGIRYLLLDLHVGVDKAPAQASAKLVLALGAAVTLLVAWRVW